MPTETVTDPTNDPANPADPIEGLDTETVAEIEKWKALSKKNEARATANAAAARELESLKQSSMTDQQKAVEAAKIEARTQVLREVGGRLAESAIKVAAAGRNVDVDALLEGVDASKFLDDTGEPDTKAITAWMDRVAPVADPALSPKRDLGLGNRGGQQVSTASPSQDLAKFITDQLNPR